MTSLQDDSHVRAGGVSGTILDDLSGSYKTFTEAIKELISNAYDADAKRVELAFRNDFTSLVVLDDGAGMNPRQFVREYIRVGRSVDAKPKSPSGARERIGGKGIGSLAPARYCKRVTIRTKGNRLLRDSVELVVPEDGRVQLSQLAPYARMVASHLHRFTNVYYVILSSAGEEGPFSPGVSGCLALPPGERCRVTYEFDAEKVWLEASIDFMALRGLGEQIELDQVADLWAPRLTDADESEWNATKTTVILEDLEDFVRNDLRHPGKTGAKNVGSKSGLERFKWTLSRLCPVPIENKEGTLQATFGPQVAELLSDWKDQFHVFLSFDGTPGDRLARQVYVPHAPVKGPDAALCRWVSFEDPTFGITVRGFVVGSPVTIYPAELRGVSVRVKGVELGAPSLFGGDALVTGPQHVALSSHITGELHVDGVDARRDILPGREGLYLESPVYRLIRKVLVGIEDRLGGEFRELVNEILLRSEAHASAQGLVKKLELQRRALMDAGSAIATLAEQEPDIVDNLLLSSSELRLLLCPDVEVRPEGRLGAFTLDKAPLEPGIEFLIDYEKRRLVLPEGALYLQRSLDLAGDMFDVCFKHGGKERVFCEVDPDGRLIFINWDHPVRGAMGDAAFIKHCLAAAVCGLPQIALNRYVQLIVTRSDKR